MGAGDAAAGSARGGDGIQALRPARARLITGAASLLALGGAGTYAAASAGRLTPVAAPLAALGAALLVVGLVLRWPSMVPWTVVAVAAAYLTARQGDALVDGWSAAVGVALLLSAELASWSIEHDARIRSEPSLVVRRAITLAALTAVALVVDFLLLGTAAVSASAGVLLAAAGVAAAVTAVAVVLRLLRA